VTTRTIRLNRETLGLIVVVLLALALRTLALGYGLPAVFNPDETPILNRALAFAKGDPNPHNFLYPSLYFYALFLWETAFFLVGRVVGLFDSLAAFQREFFTNPSRLFLAGRAMSAVCGTATVAALYYFGRRLYGGAAGLAAAAFLAVAPIAVRDAHYIKLDVPVTLVVVLAHVVLARIVVDSAAAARVKTWLLAGFLAGLAVSTHYYVAFIAVPLVVVAVADFRRSGRWRESARLLALAGAAAGAGFFAGTPFLVFEPQIAARDITAVREIDVDRALVSGTFSSLGRYAQILLTDAVGWPVCLAAVVGSVWAVVTDWRRGALLVSFTLAFLAFVANTVPMSRYLNVVLPFMALAAAFTVTRIATLARLGTIGISALVAIVAVPGLLASIRTDLFFRQADTRALARDFIEARVPAGASFLVQPYSAPLRQSRDGLVEALRANLGSESLASIKFQMMLGLDPYPSPAYRLIYLGDGGYDADKIYISPRAFSDDDGLGPVRALRVDYVVLKDPNVENPVFGPLVSALDREGRRIAEFTPYRSDVEPADRLSVAPFLHNTAARIDRALERPGPGIVIWLLNPTPGR
jgi:hypothetical protein